MLVCLFFEFFFSCVGGCVSVLVQEHRISICVFTLQDA